MQAEKRLREKWAAGRDEDILLLHKQEAALWDQGGFPNIASPETQAQGK